MIFQKKKLPFHFQNFQKWNLAQTEQIQTEFNLGWADWKRGNFGDGGKLISPTRTGNDKLAPELVSISTSFYI